MRLRTVAAVVLGVMLLLGTMGPARADQDDSEERARAAFKEGAALAEQAEWARALAAFEQSRAARDHALSIFNIGVCQRYLGRYTLARETLRAALARNEKMGEMPALFVEQATTYLNEIEQKVARVTVSVKPRATAVAVEGRPLIPAEDRPGVWVAGVAAGGVGKSTGADQFEVIVDPGVSVFTFTLEGHETIEVRRELKPGTTTPLPISMTEQPATVQISSDRDHAIVRVDDVDVGMTPVLVSRPPGTYRLSIIKNGFAPYESQLALKPGQDLRLDAKLLPERVPLTKKWWFWAAIGAAVAGAATATYFVVRPEPTRPEVDKGGLNWAAEVP